MIKAQIFLLLIVIQIAFPCCGGRNNENTYFVDSTTITQLGNFGVIANDSTSKTINVKYYNDLKRNIKFKEKSFIFQNNETHKVDTNNLIENGFNVNSAILKFSDLDSIKFISIYKEKFSDEVMGGLAGAATLAFVLSLTQGIDFLSGGDFRWEIPVIAFAGTFSIKFIWDVFDKNEKREYHEVWHFKSKENKKTN